MRIQHKKRLNIILILTIGAVLLLGGYTLYAANSHLWPFPSKEAVELQEIEKKIDYSPPTESEITNSQEGKKNSADIEGASPSNPNESKSVPVEISFAAKTENNTIDIRAFTPGVIEGSGVCTATLTKDSESVTATSNAFVDASSSICEPIIIPSAKFTSKGVWTLIVTYTSPSSTGASSKTEVTI